MIHWRERAMAGGIGLTLLVLLCVSASLAPSPAGHGTHEQLGLPACGFYVSTGLPCPTCGMTTAVSYAAHGELFRSFLTQPMGAVLGLGASVMVWGCVHVLVFGSRLGRVAGRMMRPPVLWALVVMWGASWGYTMLVW